ncbi:hypothetical protein B484DRAFT_438586, partial [Ochromonadaceae sp. CCMP2298]
YTVTLHTIHYSGQGVGDPKWITAVDMNNDGDLDLLVADEAGTNQIRWYKGGGSWDFADSFSVLNPTSGGVQVRMVRAIDMNGDGRMDVVYGTWRTDEIGWCEQLASQEFTKHVIGTADAVTWVDVADIDRDGELDVVCTAEKGNEVIIY